MKSLSWLLTLLVCISYYDRTDGGCKPIPLESVKVAIEASIMAYEDCDDKLVENNTMSTTGFKIDKVLREEYRGVPIVAFQASDSTRTVIAFRGTKGGMQLLDELKGATETKEQVGFNATFPEKVGILPYFWNAYYALNADRFLPTGIEERRKYIITGHSLGGALASIFALVQKKRFPEHAKQFWREDLHNVLITFGQPRVGNNAYADAHDKLIPPYKKLRFVDHRDPVAIVPPKPLYRHHGTKIFHVDNKIKVCPQGDEPAGCDRYNFRGIRTYHAKTKYKETIGSNKKWKDEFGGTHDTFEESQCVTRPG